jgi:hypothetical protein
MAKKLVSLKNSSSSLKGNVLSSPKSPRTFKRSISSPRTFKRSISSPGGNRLKRSATTLRRTISSPKRQLSRTVTKTKKCIKTRISPNFGVRAKKACKLTKKYDIFTGGLCTKCIEDMPKEIKNIKYLTDVDLVDKLEKACKNNKLHAYCNECKHSFIVHKSNIALFSSKEFEKVI